VIGYAPSYNEIPVRSFPQSDISIEMPPDTRINEQRYSEYFMRMLTDVVPDITDRPFESFSKGEKASFVKEITSEDFTRFESITGDHNPIHTDDFYASAAGYDHRIAYGLLVAGPISTLAGHLLPGRRCVLLEVSSRFILPVFSGDILTYHGEITQISPSTRVLKVQVEVINQENAVVLTGSYTGKVLQTSVNEDKS